MAHRNRTLRVALAAAVLSVALGATQAAVIPRADTGPDVRARNEATRVFHGWVPTFLKVVRIGTWLTPLPTPPPELEPPATDDPLAPVALDASKDREKLSTRKAVDGADPM